MQKERLWTAPYVMILIVNAVNGIASYMVNPIMPDFLAANGVAFELTGIISSLLSWVALVFRPFSGALSDRGNKKVLTIGAFLVTAGCMLGYYFVGSASAVVAVRIIHGVAFAVSGTISMAFATSFVPQSRIAEGISFLGIATLLGTMFGPQIGTFIADAASLKIIFLVAAVLCFVCVVMVSAVRYEDKGCQGWGRAKMSLGDFFAGELLIYVVLIAAFSFGNGIISYYLISFGKARGIANISLFFTVYSISMLMMKPFVGKLQDAKGIRVILYPSFAVYAVGVVLLARAYTLLPVLVAAVFKAVGQGNGTPAIQAESVKKLGPGRNGVAISTCFIGQDIGNATGPIFASFLIQRTGYETMFFVYAAMLVVCMGIYLIYDRRNAGKAA